MKLLIVTVSFFGTLIFLSFMDTRRVEADIGYVAIDNGSGVGTSSESVLLDRIAFCESSGRQFDRDGNVLIHRNTDGSEDIGIMQINGRAWGETAEKAGFDLSTIKGNKGFGIWLFERYGTRPWKASSGCWG